MIAFKTNTSGRRVTVEKTILDYINLIKKNYG